jgi:hypothetical protein
LDPVDWGWVVAAAAADMVLMELQLVAASDAAWFGMLRRLPVVDLAAIEQLSWCASSCASCHLVAGELLRN